MALAALDRPGPIPAGPAVRRLAREQGVDLRTVAGSGNHGRITAEDLQAVSPAASVPESPLPVAAPTGPIGPAAATASPRPIAAASPAAANRAPDAWGPVRVEKLSRIRRTIAEQMTRAASTIPHVTNFDDADVTELERLRQGVPAGQIGRRTSSSR